MIKNQKTAPEGIDYFIDVCQILMQRIYPTFWGVSESTLHFYPRVERIDEGTDRERLVVFVSGDKYEDIGMNTKLNFISYFEILGNEHDFDREIADASFYCHGNVKNLYSSITGHRADKEFEYDMKQFILSQIISPEDFGNIEPIDNKLMQPFHSFKINFKINF